jgi:hypothetical protein
MQKKFKELEKAQAVVYVFCGKSLSRGWTGSTSPANMKV